MSHQEHHLAGLVDIWVGIGALMFDDWCDLFMTLNALGLVL